MDLRSQILAANDTALATEPVPAWGCTVYLRPLTLADRIAYLAVADDERAATLAVLTAGVRDADGSPVFTEADAEALMLKNGAILQDLAKKVLKLKAASQEAVDALEKN